MPAMTSAGARLILDGYYSATSEKVKFHNEVLLILEHFILNKEDPETIKIFRGEIACFMDELETNGRENQIQ